MKNMAKSLGFLFLAFTIICFVFSCATAPPAEEKKAAPPPKKMEKAEPAKPAPGAAEMKWTSDADGLAKDGKFVRTNAPAAAADGPGSPDYYQPRSASSASRGIVGISMPTIGSPRFIETCRTFSGSL